MKCMCGDPECNGEVQFDSESGALLVDMNRAYGSLRGVGMVYLDAEGATQLARHLKTFLLKRADTPSDERVIVTPPDGAHP